MNKNIKAIIFDMDGVLIDSELEYIKYFEKFLAESKVYIKREELYFLAGSSSPVEDEFLAKKLKISIKEAKERKKVFYKQYHVDYMKLRKEYVKEILDYLKMKNIQIALASSAPMVNIEEVLLQCEIKDYFSFLVSGEMFKQSKPHPEIYEYTIKMLKLEKEEILVVEDSGYGIEAAKRAGLKVIAVIDPILNFNVEKADYRISTLKELKEIIR